VRFLICANTLRERKIDGHDLYGVKAEDIVPSGVAELARLQGMGFVYNPSMSPIDVLAVLPCRGGGSTGVKDIDEQTFAPRCAIVRSWH
jgi:hypothetical protein